MIAALDLAGNTHEGRWRAGGFGQVVGSLFHFPLRMAVVGTLLLVSSELAAQLMIDTVAGSGRTLQGAGGPAVDVSLPSPVGLAADRSGNLHIVDSVLNVVARVDTQGKLWHVAGTGMIGDSPQVGPAALAQFRIPGAIGVSHDGLVYVADNANGRLRWIRPDGTIETIAGCNCTNWGDGLPALSAGIYLWGTAFGFAPSGDLLFTEAPVGIVRRLDRQGFIHRFAGWASNPFQPHMDFAGDGGPASAAEMNWPGAVVVDGAGTTYIADTGNNRIRKVTLDGTISTFAGGGTERARDGIASTNIQLNGPSGVAVDEGGNVIFSDTFDGQVLKVTQAGVVSVVAGSGRPGALGDGGRAVDASLNEPRAVTLDAAGNVYIADFQNRRIRKVDLRGLITTVAGSGRSNYGGDGDSARAALLDNPQDVDVDAGGNLFIADTGNHRIRRVDRAGVITTVAGTGLPGFSGDGGEARAAALNSPTGVAVDAAGNLFIVDSQNGRIRKVDGAGRITTIAGAGGSPSCSSDGIPALTACIGGPHDVAVEADGTLLITESHSGRIRSIGRDGVIRTVAGNGTREFSGDGGRAVAAGLEDPQIVLPDRRGGFYIADIQSMRIRYVDPSGIIRTVLGNGKIGFDIDVPAETARFEWPSGLALGRDGTLYAVGGVNAIMRVDEDGIVRRILGNNAAQEGFAGDGGPAADGLVYNAKGMAFDLKGNLYIADWRNDRIRRITPPSVRLIDAVQPKPKMHPPARSAPRD